MSLPNIILMLVCVIGISAGQILFKLASPDIPRTLQAELWISFLLNKYLVLALLIYGISTFLWIFALKNIALTIAYPFMALAFIIVPLTSHLILGEELRLNTIFGACIIIAGLIVSTRGT